MPRETSHDQLADSPNSRKRNASSWLSELLIDIETDPDDLRRVQIIEALRWQDDIAGVLIADDLGPVVGTPRASLLGKAGQHGPIA